MVKKMVKYSKFVLCIALILSLVAPSYAALSASDGSAFVTKAEFDSALADFNARLTTFEAGINSKIDSQVTSYLDRNGIWNGKVQDIVKKYYYSAWGSTCGSTTYASSPIRTMTIYNQNSGRYPYGMEQVIQKGASTVVDSANKSGLMVFDVNLRGTGTAATDQSETTLISSSNYPGVYYHKLTYKGAKYTISQFFDGTFENALENSTDFNDIEWGVTTGSDRFSYNPTWSGWSAGSPWNNLKMMWIDYTIYTEDSTGYRQPKYSMIATNNVLERTPEVSGGSAVTEKCNTVIVPIVQRLVFSIFVQKEQKIILEMALKSQKMENNQDSAWLNLGSSSYASYAGSMIFFNRIDIY